MSAAIIAASSASKRTPQIYRQENRSCGFWLKALLVVAFALLFFAGFNNASEAVRVDIAHKSSQDSASPCYAGGYHLVPTPTALPSWDPQKLIDRVKASKWSYELNPYPLTPSRRNCINRTEVERFDAQTGRWFYNPLIKRLFNHTLIVSHPEFEAMLSYAAKNFTDYLLDLPGEQRDYILVFPEPRKSERWVAELLLKYLSLLPLDVTLMNHLPVSLKKYPYVKRVVIADDAAYSCKWMTTNMARATYHRLGPVTIHSIVPFMSFRDCFNKEFEILQGGADGPGASKIMVHTALEFGHKLAMTTIFQGLDSISMNWLWSAGLLSVTARYAIAFDHKLADFQSIPREFYRAENPVHGDYLFLDDPVPPYRNDGGQDFNGQEWDVRMEVGDSLTQLFGYV